MLRHESLKDKDVFLYNHPTVSRLTKAIAPHYHLLPGPHSDFPNCPILISNSSFFKIIYLNSICPPTCVRVYISTQLLKSGPRVTLPGEPLLPRRPWEQRWPCPARPPIRVPVAFLILTDVYHVAPSRLLRPEGSRMFRSSESSPVSGTKLGPMHLMDIASFIPHDSYY